MWFIEILPNRKHEALNRLLQRLIQYWDADANVFNIRGETPDLTFDDIYFITGLSRRGDLVNLKGFSRNVGAMSVQDYVNAYCVEGTEKCGSQILISTLTSFPLRVIIRMLNRMGGSAAQHLASKYYMHIGIECLQGHVYDWCTSLLANMKLQLSGCKIGRMKNFGYGIILCTFFFERVPALSLGMPLPPVISREPRLGRWGDIFLRQGGGESYFCYHTDDFWRWWER